jgi:hypothetical protein
MARNGTLILIVGLILGVISGCGTIANMNGREHVVLIGDLTMAPERPTMPFGGVANDLAMIKKVEYPIGHVFWATDMAFSLVGDLVTAPWAAYRGLNVSRRKSDEAVEPRTK